MAHKGRPWERFWLLDMSMGPDKRRFLPKRYRWQAFSGTGDYASYFNGKHCTMDIYHYDLSSYFRIYFKGRLVHPSGYTLTFWAWYFIWPQYQRYEMNATIDDGGFFLFYDYDRPLQALWPYWAFTPPFSGVPGYHYRITNPGTLAPEPY